MKTFVKGSVVSLAGVGILGVLNYLVRRRLSIDLTEADYGIFYGTMALASMVFGFCDLGMTQSGSAMIAKYSDPARRNACFNALLFSKTAIALLCFAIMLASAGALARGYLHISSALPLLLFSGILALQSIEGSLRALWNGLKKFVALQIFQLIAVALLLIGATLIVPRYGLTGALALFLAVPILLTPAEWIFSIRSCKQRPSFHIDIGTLRELFKMSVPVALSTTMLSTVYYMDTVMLTTMKGVTSAAMYNIALPIMQIVQALMIFPQVFLPLAMEMGARGENASLRRFARVAALTAAVAAIPVYFAFYWSADFLIRLLFSAKYAAAAPALPLLCAGIVFYTLGNFLFQILLSIGELRAMALIAIAVAAANVALNIVFIGIFDFTGAALATMASYIFFAAAAFAFLEWKLKGKCEAVSGEDNERG